jgi:hypothetical protein
MTWAGRLALLAGAVVLAVLAVVLIDSRGGRVALAVVLVALGVVFVWLGRDRS